MIIQPPQDLWTYPADCYVITTNGTLHRDGRAIMGRGIAKQAKDKFPGVAHTLGRAIQDYGNHVHLFMNFKQFLCSFPVKRNWWDRADIELIRRSAGELAELASVEADITFAMPFPGCHNGQLEWLYVRPVIEPILPDNVHIVDYSANEVASYQQ